MMKKNYSWLVLASIALSIGGAKAKEKSEMTVIGEIESVTLVKDKFQLLARIDTGAQTSSISAQKIEKYERDGKKWVRFEVMNVATKKMVKFERPLSRIVSIKRHGASALDRPVVNLAVAMGPIKCVCEFSLAVRSKYEFPVLIGRNFLSGRAVVDVSRKHAVHPVTQEESDEN